MQKIPVQNSWFFLWSHMRWIKLRTRDFWNLSKMTQFSNFFLFFWHIALPLYFLTYMPEFEVRQIWIFSSRISTILRQNKTLYSCNDDDKSSQIPIFYAIWKKSQNASKIFFASNFFSLHGNLMLNLWVRNLSNF